MKTNISLSLFFVLAFFSIQAINAQEAVVDFKKSQATYAALENYHGKMVSTTYGESAEILDVSEVEVKKKGQLFRYDQGETEAIINPNYMVTHNKEENILACNRVHTPNGLQNPIAIDLEGMLESYEEVIFKGVVSGTKCYVLKDEYGPFEVIEFYFDQSTALIQKLVYHYREHPEMEATKVEIICEHLSLNPTFADAVFSEREFVSINGNVVKAQSSFSNCTLILGDGLEYAQH